MLYQVGEVTFEVIPINIDAHDRTGSADYAIKDVMNVYRPAEFTGEGDDLRNMSGKLLPLHFGGLEELEMLHKMRVSGIAYHLLRGDGRNEGWFNILTVNERHSNLHKDGIGNMIEFDIAIRRGALPSPRQYIRTLLKLLT